MKRGTTPMNGLFRQFRFEVNENMTAQSEHYDRAVM